jgi:hypothetical protein
MGTLEKILTLDNLRKRNIMVLQWCCLCKNSGESIENLLLHFEVAIELWSVIFQLFGVAWVMPLSVCECSRSWRSQYGNRTALCIWRMTPLCLMWCLWREQNARTFEDRETSLLDLKKLVLHSLFTWRVDISPISNFSKLLDLCSFSMS